MGLTCSAVGASPSSDLDILVNPAASPYSKIRLGKTFPKPTKGSDDRVVSECLDLRKGGFSNARGLDFVHDGRTLIFNFNSSGSAISRGGVR